MYLMVSQWAKSPKKQSVGVYINENTLLLDCFFLAILPTGVVLHTKERIYNKCLVEF